MVKRFLFSVALLIPVAIIAQIDWTKQLKNVPAYVTNALGDPGAAGFVKRTTANTSTVAGGADVWPGTIPYSSVTSAPTNLVVGGGTTVVGNIPEWNNTTGTLLQPGISPTGAWPGTLPFTSLTATPNLLRDPGANGVVYRNALNTTAAATGANLPLMVASGASHSAGAVPDPGAVAGTTHFLREDGTWQTVSSGISVQSGNLGPQNGGAATRGLNAGPYQNTTGKPMFIMATVLLTGTNGLATPQTDACGGCPGTPPTTKVGEAALNITGTAWFSLSWYVLPGNWYFLNASGTTAPILEYWVEWN
jgi:hypothetical protein